MKLLESFNIGMWAGDANQDELGWGVAGSPGHEDDIVKATAPFGDAVEAMAELFGSTSMRSAARWNSRTPNRTSTRYQNDHQKGTVAGIEARWIGSTAAPM